jgi:hypothetical protein
MTRETGNAVGFGDDAAMGVCASAIDAVGNGSSSGSRADAAGR